MNSELDFALFGVDCSRFDFRVMGVWSLRAKGDIGSRNSVQGTPSSERHQIAMGARTDEFHLRLMQYFLPLYLLAVALVMSVAAVAAEGNGDRRGVVVVGNGEDELTLYRASYALLVGVSDYTAGWPDLESVPGELESVETTLRERGFTVVTHLNPTSEQLERAFEDFIDEYGLDGDNRLLFMFAGHGHTRLAGSKGYLVPADAPDPLVDEPGFIRKALSLNQVMSWARRIESRHALFLFDSCFSGTVFKTRELAGAPAAISQLTAEPVRYFITAGKAGEAVPAQSVFTPAFVDAIRFGAADMNQDGYVTGTELGLYLRSEVPRFARQTPQFGPIQDYELSRGDFVIAVSQPRPLVKGIGAPPPPPPAPVTFTGHLQVNSDRPVEVYLNGVPVGRAAPGGPLNRANVPVGIVEVRAVDGGGSVITRSATVSRGQWTQLVLDFGGTPVTAAVAQPATEPSAVSPATTELEPAPPPPPVAESDAKPPKALPTITAPRAEPTGVDDPAPAPRRLAMLTLRSNVRDDQVFVNGEPKGSTRLDLELEPGRHAIRVEKPGYVTYESELNLAAGESRTIWAKLQPPKPAAEAKSKEPVATPPPEPMERTARVATPVNEETAQSPKIGTTAVVLVYAMPHDEGRADDDAVERYSLQVARMMVERLRQQGYEGPFETQVISQSTSYALATDTDDGRHRRPLCDRHGVDRVVSLLMKHEYLGFGQGYAYWREPTFTAFDCNKGQGNRMMTRVAHRPDDALPYIANLTAAFDRFVQGNQLLQ